jgi:hypothetical protein
MYEEIISGNFFFKEAFVLMKAFFATFVSNLELILPSETIPRTP